MKILLSLILLGVLVVPPGCGTPGRNIVVALDDAEEPEVSTRVARLVGLLLSSDPDESKAAEVTLTALDEEERQALLEHATRIPLERDPRWLHVLDENHALEDLPPAVELDFLLWKASRPETPYAMKAQGRLLEMATSDPDILLGHLESGGPGSDAVAVALAMGGQRRAVPILLDRYRHPRSDGDRRVAAEALARLAGEELRPRLRGSTSEIEHDAAAIQRWYESPRGEERDRGGN